MDIINFILTYFVTKDLYTMSAFICWPPDQIMRLWRDASDIGTKLRVSTDLRHPPRIIPYDWHTEAMLLDLNCPDADNLLHYVSSFRGFNYRHSWLLLHNASYDRNIVENILEPYEILPDADVVWASLDSLVDVYRIKAKQPYLITNLGLNRNCSIQDLLALRSSLASTVSRRKNLKNVTIPAASVITQPDLFHTWSDISTRQTETSTKFSYALMMIAAEDLNIHYNLRQLEMYGLSTNGSFNGILGLLQRQEVELGVTNIYMRVDRMEVTDYLFETAAVSCTILFRQPPRSAVSNVFLAPFSPGVWLSCGIFILLAAILISVFKKVKQTINKNSSESLELLASLTVSDTWTFVIGTMCQQGFHITPPVMSIRVVMFTTLMTSLFLFTSYSANIVTLLQTPSTAIRTIDDLTKSPMTVAELISPYKKIYYTESPDPATQRLYRRKFLPQGERAYISLEEGMERVRTELFAFSVERSPAYDVIKKKYTEREKCALHEIDAFKAPMVCLPFKKYSGYKKLFAVRLRWLREVGLMDKTRSMWLVSKPRCETNSGDFVSIGITDVLPALQGTCTNYRWQYKIDKRDTMRTIEETHQNFHYAIHNLNNKLIM